MFHFSIQQIMNYKKLLSNVQSVNLSDSAKQAVDGRAAVQATPLSVGDIIKFDDNAAGISRVIDVAGNAVRMLYGVRVADKSEAITDDSEGIQVSCVAFGRQVRNPQTKSVVSPITVAQEANVPTDKLAFNALRDMTIGDVPAYVAGKAFQVLAAKDVAVVRADGQPRLNSNNEPMFQTVMAIAEL